MVEERTNAYKLSSDCHILMVYGLHTSHPPISDSPHKKEISVKPHFSPYVQFLLNRLIWIGGCGTGDWEGEVQLLSGGP